MSGFRHPVLFWILGLGLAAGSIAGTGLVLASHHGLLLSDAAPPTAVPGDTSAGAITCFGHADVEGGVCSLSPLQPGRVQQIYVHENDEVPAGATLLQLDTRPAEHLVRQARADLEAAQAQLIRARKGIDQQKVRETEQLALIEVMRHRLEAARWVLARKKELITVATNDKEVAAAQEQCAELEAAVRGEEAKLQELGLNDPTVDSRRAEADVAAKQAHLDQALLGLDECRLKAPVDGTVLRILVSRGDVLGSQPNRPAVLFCPKGPRIVRAEVQQEFAAGVAAGQSVLIHDDSRSGPTWRGKVRRLSDWYSHRRSIWQEPLQHNDVRTLECIIDLEPEQPPLRIGQRLLVQVVPVNP
jgi:multidrug resistance efflux pump